MTTLPVFPILLVDIFGSALVVLLSWAVFINSRELLASDPAKSPINRRGQVIWGGLARKKRPAGLAGRPSGLANYYCCVQGLLRP